MGRFGQLVRVGIGLLLGLVITEVAFSVRADGAFPHINVLQEDPVLGVRLIPGETQRVKVADNPTSTLSINQQGWRGADFTETGGIVVVGDSQVFGLGVDDDQTTPAQLSAVTGEPVYNGGVPTYGPEEYLKVIEELCASQNPKAVVVVLNFANDLFELGRPNLERHRVWDGWAVRMETAPEQVRDFPGRRWLFSQSHAVYAFRRFLYEPDERDDGQGFPSEGSVSDAMSAMLSQQLAEGGATDAEITTLLQGISDVGQQKLDLDNETVSLMRNVMPYTYEEETALEMVERRARPGDIVHEGYAEASRDIEVTAAMLRQGARLQRNMKKDFVVWLSENPEHPLAQRLQQNQSEQETLGARLDTLTDQIATDLAAISPFENFLQRAGAITAAHNAALVVVALPMDVQVDPQEWQKYGEAVEDMSETLVLLKDLTRTAEAMGFRALDATEPLRNAQPGAFLNADIHLTPHGHQALAEAIAQALSAPPPRILPAEGIIEGRSRVPLAVDWVGIEENLVRGSTKNNCITRQIREWQRVTCLIPDNERFAPVSVVLEDGPAETMLLSTDTHTDLLTPLIPGQELSALFHWTNRVQRLRITWDGQTPVMGFTAAPGVERISEPTPDPLASCLMSEQRDHTELWFGDASRGCAQTWSDCPDLISCAQGARIRPPVCPEGQARAGAAGHCYALCDDDTPCETGTCQDWMGGLVCL